MLFDHIVILIMPAFYRPFLYFVYSSFAMAFCNLLCCFILLDLVIVFDFNPFTTFSNSRAAEGWLISVGGYKQM